MFTTVMLRAGVTHADKCRRFNLKDTLSWLTQNRGGGRLSSDWGYKIKKPLARQLRGSAPHTTSLQAIRGAAFSPRASCCTPPASAALCHKRLVCLQKERPRPPLAVPVGVRSLLSHTRLLQKQQRELGILLYTQCKGVGGDIILHVILHVGVYRISRCASADTQQR